MERIRKKTEKGKGALKLAGILFAFLLFIWFTLAATSGIHAYRQYVDEPTMGAMLLFTIAALWLGGMGKDFLSGIRLAVSKQEDCSRVRLQRACNAVKYARTLVFLEAVVQICIWGVDFMYTVGGRPAMTLGPGFAILLLSIVYASLIAVLLTIFIAKLENMLASYREIPETGGTDDKGKGTGGSI